MNCSHPITVDGRSMPCGHCVHCRIQYSREWAMRILHEAEEWEGSCFVTYTYDDKKYIPAYGLIENHMVKYWKKIRKEIFPRKIKYFCSGEYGDESGRPHYHAIIFGISRNEVDLLSRNWIYGRVWISGCGYESARYVAQYIMKKYNGKKAEEEYGILQPPFMRCSKGIGYNWALANYKLITDKGFIQREGVKMSIPRTYLRIVEKFSNRGEVLRMVEARNMNKVAKGSLDEERAIKRGLGELELAEYRRRQRKTRDADAKAKATLFKRKL